MWSKKHRFSSNLKVSVYVLLFALFFSCGEKKQTRVRLTSAERVKVDTLYSREVKTLRPFLDSVCDANFDKLVDHAVDSILEVRREEEIRLRKRIPKLQ